MEGQKVEIIKKLRYVFFALFAAGLSFSIAWTNISIALIVLNEIAFFAMDRRSVVYRKTPFDVIFLCMVASFVISAVFGVDPGNSFSKLKSELLFLVFYLVYYCVTGEHARKLIKIFIIFSVMLSIFGIMQYFLKIDWYANVFHLKYGIFGNLPDVLLDHLSIWNGRVRGTRSHPITFAECIFFSFIINGAFLMHARKTKSIVIWSSSFLIQGLALLLSYSRGVWMASLFSIVCLAIISFKSKKRYVLGMFTVLFFVFVFHPGLKDRILSRDVLSKGSNAIRINLWKTGVDISRDYPVLGVGPGNVKKVYMKYQQPEIPDKRVWSELHSIYLQFLAERGVVGLGIFLWFAITALYSLILFLRISLRSGRDAAFAKGIFAAFLGFLVYNLTENSFFDSEIALILYFITGCAFTIFAPKKE